MITNTGGPAFPVSTGNPDEPYQNGHSTAQFPGMTLRDYFAAKAMQGAISKHGVYIEDRDDKSLCPERIAREVFEAALYINEVAEYSYALADAMLAARRKPNE